jgi:hypothetical protein
MNDAPAPLTHEEIERTLWSKFWSKDFWLAIAEIVDAFRLFPRAFVAGYGLFCLELGRWAMSRPDLTTQQMAFVIAVIGLFTPILAFYQASGRKWGSQ